MMADKLKPTPSDTETKTETEALGNDALVVRALVRWGMWFGLTPKEAGEILCSFMGKNALLLLSRVFSHEFDENIVRSVGQKLRDDKPEP